MANVKNATGPKINKAANCPPHEIQGKATALAAEIWYTFCNTKLNIKG